MFNPRRDKPLEGSRSVHHADRKFLKNLSNSESDNHFLTNPTLTRFCFVLLEGARTCPHRSYDEELLARRYPYLLDGGMELGDANDRVFATVNSKQAGGAYGLLTDGLYTRQSVYTQTLILALIPFVNELYT